MAAHVNIYVAGDVAAGVLANRRRCAASFLRVQCLSDVAHRSMHSSKPQTQQSTAAVFRWQERHVTDLLPWLQKPGLKLGFKRS